MQKEYKLWPAAYVDARTGEGVTDQQEAFSVGKRPSLARVVAGVPERIRRVYLVGPRPGRDGSAEGMRRWLTDDRLADEWKDDGSYLHHRTPTVRLTHRATERALDISRAAMWFDNLDYSVHDAERAMAALVWLLRHRAFDEHACPLGSPGQTGCDLWSRSLGPRVKPEDVFPPLPEDVRQLIKGTSGQGRYELHTPPGAESIPALHYLDGRFMYAGISGTELPVGLVAHDNGHDLLPYEKARYRVTFRVPDDWPYVGLLGVWDAKERHWHYPTAPGSQWETWADGCEVQLAMERGWPVQIHERLIFGKDRPLRLWTDRLVNLRASIADYVRAGRITPLRGRMLEGALRALVLHAVGFFGRKGREQTRIVYSADLRSVDEREADIAPVRPGVFLVTEYKPLGPNDVAYMHPEWAAHIWARTRTRLLYFKQRQDKQIIGETGALTVPRSHVLGFRLDAIYLTHQPNWIDRGVVGDFRLKGALAGPLPAPHDEDSLLDLRDQAERTLTHATSNSSTGVDRAAIVGRVEQSSHRPSRPA